MSVVYSNNVVLLTPNNFVTAVTLSLSFIELTNLTRQDIIDVKIQLNLQDIQEIDT